MLNIIKKQILIPKNINHENLGLLSEVLKENSLKFDIIDLSQKIEFPEIKNYKLLIVLGIPIVPMILLKKS